MDAHRQAAILIALGPILLISAGIVTPPGLYQEPEAPARIRIIADEYVRFLLAQILWALMLAAPAAGFVLLALQGDQDSAWLTRIGTAAIVLGAGAGIGFVVLQTADPGRFWLAGEGTWLSLAGAWLFVIAAGCFGAWLVQGPMVAAGLVLAGYAVIGAAALLLGAPPFFVVAGFVLVLLVRALSLWTGWQLAPPSSLWTDWR